jgi:hypothetical protein
MVGTTADTVETLKLIIFRCERCGAVGDGNPCKGCRNEIEEEQAKFDREMKEREERWLANQKAERERKKNMYERERVTSSVSTSPRRVAASCAMRPRIRRPPSTATRT